MLPIMIFVPEECKPWLFHFGIVIYSGPQTDFDNGMVPVHTFKTPEGERVSVKHVVLFG